MNLKQEMINRIHNNFIGLKGKQELDNEDLSALETDLTCLLGIYRFSKTEYLYNEIKNMIEFGEEHGIDMMAARILFWQAHKKKD